MSPKKQARPIKIGTHTLKEEDEATYLFRQEADMEDTYPTQEAGNNAQTNRNNMGS